MSAQPGPAQLLELLRDRAAELGLHGVGVTSTAPPARAQEYQRWLELGHHGAMSYMAAAEHVRGRLDPSALLDEARSIVVVALAYPRPTESGALALEEPTLRGRIAGYAGGDDYHTVLHNKLRGLAAALDDALGDRELGYKVCVDTAPLLERELAERAGLGFVGKNTMLIIPGVGSYIMLGALLVDVEIETTPAEPSRASSSSPAATAASRCGSCRACLDACPTQAFEDAFRLDARKCIAYLTIEQRGEIPEPLRASLGDRVFGCDACQAVCPFNAAAPDRTPAAPELHPRDLEHSRPDLLRLLGIGANQRRRFVDGTALRRAGRAELARNVCVALGNARDPRARAALERAAQDRSELVREHATWALSRLVEDED